MSRGKWPVDEVMWRQDKGHEPKSAKKKVPERQLFFNVH